MRDENITNWFLFIQMLCFSKFFLGHRPGPQSTLRHLGEMAEEVDLMEKKLKVTCEEHYFGRFRSRRILHRGCHFLRTIIYWMTFCMKTESNGINSHDPDTVAVLNDRLESWTDKSVGRSGFSFEDDIKWTLGYHYSVWFTSDGIHDDFIDELIEVLRERMDWIVDSLGINSNLWKHDCANEMQEFRRCATLVTESKAVYDCVIHMWKTRDQSTEYVKVNAASQIQIKCLPRLLS